MSDPNKVQVTMRQGAAEAGVCESGPLAGHRVVRHSGGAWFPAGPATANDRRGATSAWFRQFSRDLFGTGGW